MHSLVDPIIQDMMMQNVIPEGQNDLSFELTGKMFTVNGKKQPAEVHERFKAKYLKKDGDYFKFSKKDGHTSISINTN